jgi:hypothetical protein
MPPSTPFRPPRSARAPALESAAGEKRAPPQNSPQAASKSAYGTISSAAAASPGAARVNKLKDECEQLMMQLGCVHLIFSLTPIRELVLDSSLPLCDTAERIQIPCMSPTGSTSFPSAETSCSRCGTSICFPRRRVTAHEKAQREVRHYRLKTRC